MMDDDDQPDLFGAKGERDENLDRVLANAGMWSKLALDAIARLPEGSQASGEDIRLWLTPIIGPPHHHNAWGALIMVAVKHKLLRDIGSTHMRTERSHARKTTLYRRT